MRVRTTCRRAAPARSSAASMLRSACRVCARASPTPTTAPLASVAVVPATWTWAPTRTALEYPTIGSQGVPLEIRVRLIAGPYRVGEIHGKRGVATLVEGFGRSRRPAGERAVGAGTLVGACPHLESELV